MLAEKYEHLKPHNYVYNNRVQEVLKKKHYCCLIQGTGTGKSYQASQVIYDMVTQKWSGSHSINVLVIVPTTALVSDWARRLGESGSFLAICKDNEVNEAVQRSAKISFRSKEGKNCSVSWSAMTFDGIQELADNSKDSPELTSKGKSNLAKLLGENDLIVIDEVHHACATTYFPAIQFFIDNCGSNKYILGITATPSEKDPDSGKTTRDLFHGSMIHGPSTVQAQEGNYEVYKDDKEGETELAGKPILPGTKRIVSVVFDKRLEACKNLDEMYRAWIKTYSEEAPDNNRREIAKSCLFAWETVMQQLSLDSFKKIVKEHLLNVHPQKLICFYPASQSERLAKEFVKEAFGISNVVVFHSSKSAEQNDEALRVFRESKKDTVILSVDKLGEGLHVDGVTGLIMLRATFSARLFQQQIGRLMSSDNVGKVMPIFDIAGSFALLNDMRDGMPDELRDFLDSPLNGVIEPPQLKVARDMMQRLEVILSQVKQPKVRVSGKVSLDLAKRFPTLIQFGEWKSCRDIESLKDLFAQRLDKERNIDPSVPDISSFTNLDFCRALLKKAEGSNGEIYLQQLLREYTKVSPIKSFTDLKRILQSQFKFGNSLLSQVESHFFNSKNYQWQSIISSWRNELSARKPPFRAEIANLYLAGIPVTEINKIKGIYF